MARITQQQKEANFALYNETIWNVFVKDGWDCVTYDRLRDELGLKQKSTLQGYYPSNKSFALALRGRILPILLEHLRFDNCEEFDSSWFEAMQIREFRHSVEMIIGNSLSDEMLPIAKAGLKGLIEHVDNRIGEGIGKKVVAEALGKTVILLTFQ